ncbi:MAG: squalene/phytoene synthase family protein [candidate division Zixibacteria bacterium]
MSHTENYQDLVIVDSDFESILTNPILDIAARFWDEDRYQAFKVCYRSMREIDDLVDDRKVDGQTFSPAEQISYTENINELIAGLVKTESGGRTQRMLSEVIRRYKIPLWPWQRLARAMIYDIKNDGFDSFMTFRRYAEGAAISPASVFMHLCGISQSAQELGLPKFDICKAARPLALFSYLVHIMRDYEKDPTQNLNYFPNDFLTRHNLKPGEIQSLCKSNIVDDRVRSLFNEYKRLADYYRKRALISVNDTIPYLKPKYQLSLKLVYSLYQQIFDKIDCENGSFSTAELNPTPAEVQEKIDFTVKNFKAV